MCNLIISFTSWAELHQRSCSMTNLNKSGQIVWFYMKLMKSTMHKRKKNTTKYILSPGNTARIGFYAMETQEWWSQRAERLFLFFALTVNVTSDNQPAVRVSWRIWEQILSRPCHLRYRPWMTNVSGPSSRNVWMKCLIWGKLSSITILPGHLLRLFFYPCQCQCYLRKNIHYIQ